MKKQKKIIIGLLSHLYEHENLGCVALSISNMALIDRAANELNCKIEYKILVTDKIKQKKLKFTNNSYKYFIFPSCKQTLKNPFKLLFSKVYDDCDLIINISGGDGFTDIYGFKRFLAESYMTIFAKLKRKKVIFAPQTIGPFNGKLTKIIAKNILKKVYKVFSRDKISSECCDEISIKYNEVMDVAFALPYDKKKIKSNKLKLGINVSGLLYNGGYNNKNYFNLGFDYSKFINLIIETALKKNMEVHLIPHVNSDTNKIEDDYSVCKDLAKKYGVILAPKYDSPIDIKSYISGLDVFTGARMHSTIAAFSSGIPVIPIAYSRKFNGLYKTLNYPYYIDAKSKITKEEAAKKLFEYIEKKDKLKENIEKSKNIYEKRIDLYVKQLEEILKNEIDK